MVSPAAARYQASRPILHINFYKMPGYTAQEAEVQRKEHQERVKGSDTTALPKEGFYF